MRLTLAAIAIVIWPAVASAQTSTLAPVPPLPPIGLPLPDITAPLTPIALTPGGAARPSEMPRSRPRLDSPRRLQPYWPAVFFVPVYYPWPVTSGAVTPTVIVNVEQSSVVAPTERNQPAVSADPTPGSGGERPASSAADRTPERPPDPPAAPSTFYYIPGCYIGNVPPSQMLLPANCDRTRLITRNP